MEKDGDLHIGKVVGVHGIKGYLKVLPFAENSAPFTPGRRVYVKTGQSGKQALTVRECRLHRNLLRVAFEAIETREAAESLVGAELFINRSELPELEDDTWYWYDLIGLAVYADDTYIGRVDNIFATGANDVLVVKNEDEIERLIPVIASIVRQIDLDNKTIRVELPNGL
ncbi:MAG TPA: ribosome maturation factor RimM [Desulfosalsimonadaceae bacterium]|nr:ribosome maturation factor RimM [Desulfosalsimonadaceae bacterium]